VRVDFTRLRVIENKTMRVELTRMRVIEKNKAMRVESKRVRVESTRTRVVKKTTTTKIIDFHTHIQNGVNIQDIDSTFSYQSIRGLYFRHFRTLKIKNFGF
jgi:hypothetical protein